MKDKNIFREKLFHHTLPVRDGLWEAIEAQLPPKENRRAFPVFWFTLFATTIIGGTLMTGILNSNSTEPNPGSHNKSINLQLNKENQQEKTASSLYTSSVANASESLNKTDNPVSGNNPLAAQIKTSAKKSGIRPAANTPLSRNQSESANNPFDADQENAFPDRRISPTGVASLNSSFPISFLPMMDIDLTGEASAFTDLESFKPDPNCYKFTTPGSKYALSADFFAGPGFSPKSFEQNGGESSVYAEARKATESNQYAWSAGARINLHHRSGLTGRLGITYTQAGDLFDYTDSLATQSTTRIDSFFAADGTFLYEETSQVLIFGTLIKKIHNTYRYLDIPLLIGYELPLGRSTFMINGGPVLNITSSHKGQILDPMLHPRSITSGEPGAIDVYKTSLGLSIYLGAGMLFPLTDKLTGIVEPVFLYRLNPVTLGSYPLKEHRHYAGLNLGLRYHFN